MDSTSIENIDVLLNMVESCSGILQNEDWHPEGDVLNHSLQVFYAAARETFDRDLLLAALLHDIGKQENSYGHEKISAAWIEPFCSEKTVWLVENHMLIKLYLSGELRKLKTCKLLVEHCWFIDIIKLNRWDIIGRKPRISPIIFDKEKIKEILQRTEPSLNLSPEILTCQP